MRSSGTRRGTDAFRVLSKDLMGRVGSLRTKSGEFQTPHMFPVVDPNRPVFGAKSFATLDIHAIMTNAYLMRRARVGEHIANVHDFLGFHETVATDSGAYQLLRYGHVGVQPAEIVKYQEEIDTDIGVILDTPTGFRSDPARARWTVDETIRRADEALKVRKVDDILWVGPIQGGIHLKEVERSAREMSKRDFPIYALGSPTEVMESQRFEALVDMILTVKREIPPGKPLHLFGAGHPSMFAFIVAVGCDLFDSAAYALYARTGRYLMPEGTLELNDMDEFPCPCSACAGRTPHDVQKLEKGEREKLLTYHNLQACFSELKRIREAIRKGRLWDLLELRAYAHPALKRCLQRIAGHSEEIERWTPIVKPKGIFYFGRLSERRPELVHYRSMVSKASFERNIIVMLLPGRWRRPFHEDPRYRETVGRYRNHRKVRLVFYSIPFGPVPLELDETYPIAQTESLDSKDYSTYKAKAKQVGDFVTRLSPKRVLLVYEGEYGLEVQKQVRKTFGSRLVSINGESIKPESFSKIFAARTKRRLGVHSLE